MNGDSLDDPLWDGKRCNPRTGRRRRRPYDRIPSDSIIGPMSPKRLSVLGVGLLGGSLGLAVKRSIKGCRVVGYAHRPATLEAALERGAIDEGYADPVAAVQGADLV